MITKIIILFAGILIWFGIMPRKAFQRLKDAVEYLYSEQVDADIAALPPEVDDLTDEDDINDEELGVAIVQDIPGGTELFFTEQNTSEESSSSDEEDNVPLSSFCKKKRAESILLPPSWNKSEPNYETVNFQDCQPMIEVVKEQVSNATPLEIFECYFDDAVYDLLLTETIRYARTQKNKHEYLTSKEEIKIFIGFLIFTGYHSLPSERDYWSEREDLGVSLVKNAFSRNAYTELKSMIHFTDNSQANENKHDRSFKIRPLLTMLNERFRQWGIFHEHLSIDEMIVRYYGHHPIKQFIKAKPIRFGFKLWALCGDNGYCYNFSLYCGKEPTDQSNEPKAPLGTRVVTNMLEVIENPKRHKVYFDNFFTSYNLLCDLKQRGFCATGTVRENRTAKCPTLSSKILEKKPRGSYDWQFDHNNKILVCKWNDNKCVSLATNYDTITPVAQVQRWKKQEQKKVSIPQPQLVANYNKFMGGVDHHDWLLEKHHISVRGKKWYWCLFTRIIDMAIVNGCILYNTVHKGQKKMSIKAFRMEIAYPYLKTGHGLRVNRGRPFSLPSTSKTIVPDDIRFDGKHHYIDKREKQRRCQIMNCTGKPRTFCQKCNITLCMPGCFNDFHKKSSLQTPVFI